MNTADLDRQIFIDVKSVSDNNIGEAALDSWDLFHECYALVQRVSGNERLESDKITATNKIKFKIRFFDGILEDMTVRYNNNRYDILEIQELGREGLFLTSTRRR